MWVLKKELNTIFNYKGQKVSLTKNFISLTRYFDNLIFCCVNLKLILSNVLEILSFRRSNKFANNLQRICESIDAFKINFLIILLFLCMRCFVYTTIWCAYLFLFYLDFILYFEEVNLDVMFINRE